MENEPFNECSTECGEPEFVFPFVTKLERIQEGNISASLLEHIDRRLQARSITNIDVSINNIVFLIMQYRDIRGHRCRYGIVINEHLNRRRVLVYSSISHEWMASVYLCEGFGYVMINPSFTNVGIQWMASSSALEIALNIHNPQLRKVRTELRRRRSFQNGAA
jgi:hypothetical protein